MLQVCSLDILEFRSMAVTAPLLQPTTVEMQVSQWKYIYMVQHEGLFPFFSPFSFAFASWLP